MACVSRISKFGTNTKGYVHRRFFVCIQGLHSIRTMRIRLQGYCALMVRPRDSIVWCLYFGDFALFVVLVRAMYKNKIELINRMEVDCKHYDGSMLTMTPLR